MTAGMSEPPTRYDIYMNAHLVGVRRAAPDPRRVAVSGTPPGAGYNSPAEFVQAHTACDRYLEASGLAHVSCGFGIAAVSVRMRVDTRSV
jgi:hypothetical protein